MKKILNYGYTFLGGTIFRQICCAALKFHLNVNVHLKIFRHLREVSLLLFGEVNSLMHKLILTKCIGLSTVFYIEQDFNPVLDFSPLPPSLIQK